MIKVFEPTITLKDKFSILKNLYSTSISGNSPVINSFEQKLADNFDRKFSVATSNGSTALEVAIASLNLKKNSEVVVPSFTIISCLSAIIRNNLKPVFCDIDPDSWNMRLEDLTKVITKNTKAVLMVHTYGLTSEAVKIQNFCSENEIILIEDAAEAHGQEVDNKKCGSFGKVSTLSFYANKHITTGEGGAVLTDSEEIYLKIKKMVNLDFGQENRFNHEHLYWNFRMSGLQASLGLSQINNLRKTIDSKINQAKIYDEYLSKIDEYVQIPLTKNNFSENHYWVYGIVIKKEGLRDKLMQYLLENNIQTRQFFWPLHLQKSLPENLKNKDLNLKNSEYIGRNGLYLPVGRHVKKKHQKFIYEKIRIFFESNLSN